MMQLHESQAWMAVNSLFNNLINVEFHEQPIYGLLSMQVCMVCCQCRYVCMFVRGEEASVYLIIVSVLVCIAGVQEF